MNVLDYTVTIRYLRHYYNEVAKIMNLIDSEDITMQESEDLLIALDEEYARLITEALGKD